MKLELPTVLMALAAAALLPNPSESRTVSRCELKMELELVLPVVRPVAPGHKNTSLATIICELEKKSKLNTSLVTVEVHHKPESTNHPMMVTEENANKPNATANPSAPSGDPGQKHSSSQRKPEVKGKPTSQGKENGPGQGHEKENGPGQGHEKENGPGQGHEDSSMYGIFQLSDSEFCKSGNVQSQNKCRTNCSAFTNDDIRDDINCFVGHDYWKHILGKASSDCRNQTSFFFYECN